MQRLQKRYTSMDDDELLAALYCGPDALVRGLEDHHGGSVRSRHRRAAEPQRLAALAARPSPLFPSGLPRFDSIEQDAQSFLETFCRRFPPGVVSLTTASGFLLLTPSRPGAASVHITVRNGDPIVVADVGEGAGLEGAVLEWMADLDSYDAAWWNAKLEPLLSAVAAGQVTQIRWLLGHDVAAVDTELAIEWQIERFRCSKGFPGLFLWLFKLRGTSQVVHYKPWVEAGDEPASE